ncbi:MAG: ABC transporter permease [Candidatus Pacearchaeota archaeon]
MKELMIAEFKAFYRNPGILFWTFGFPIMLTLILGSAFTKKQEGIRKISLVSPITKETFFSDSQTAKTLYTQFIFFEDDPKSAILKLKRGEINLYITLEDDSYKYHFDPSNNESFLTYLILKESRNVANTATHEDIIELKEKGSRYIDFLLPGLLAMGIMNSCLWGSGWSLIEFRIKKLLRRLMATPLTKSQFLIAHLSMRIILSGIEFLFLTLFGFFLFGVEVQGSLLALGIIFLAGNVAFSGAAILISSRASSTQVANGLINAFTLPMMLMSGVFFSYHNFPSFLEKLASFLPLTVLADSLRGIFNEGSGLSVIFLPSLQLIFFGIICFLLGLKIYKWD